MTDHAWKRPLRDLPQRELLALVLGPEADGLAGVERLEELAREGMNGSAALVPFSPALRRRVGAVFELARRTRLAARAERPVLRSASRVAAFLDPELEDASVEVFRVLVLDARHRLLAAPEVSRGTLTASLVHPREVFRPALAAGGASIIVVHNHPSGDPQPSAEDHQVTQRLSSAGEILGIPVLDHVVLACPRWYSYRENGHSALLG